MVGSSWTFVQKGLDDFRDGIPPDIAADKMILKVSNNKYNFSILHHIQPVQEYCMGNGC